MATYRCKTCLGLYVDPQPSGVPYYHACPPVVDPLVGAKPRPNHRDENVVADFIPGKDPLEGRVFTAATVRVRMKSPGLGRELVDPGDVLSGADAAAIAQLQQRPGQDLPDPPGTVGPVVDVLPPAPAAPGP